MEYVNLLANNDLISLLKDNLALRRGLNTYNGKLTIEAVAIDLDLPYFPVNTALEA